MALDKNQKQKKINLQCNQKSLHDMKLHCNYNNILNFTMYFWYWFFASNVYLAVLLITTYMSEITGKRIGLMHLYMWAACYLGEFVLN